MLSKLLPSLSVLGVPGTWYGELPKMYFSGTLSTTIFCHKGHYFSGFPPRNLAFN